MKKFIVLAVVTAAVVLGGCNPCKRLALKCPTHDSTTIVTERIRDSIIIHIPGDSVFVTIPVETLEDLGLISEESGRAQIDIRYIHDTLFVGAKCKDDSLKAEIEHLKTTIKHTKSRIVKVEVPVEVKHVPKIYKITLWIVIILIIVTVVWLYFKIKAGWLKSALDRFR